MSQERSYSGGDWAQIGLRWKDCLPPPQIKKVLRIRKTSVLAQERYCAGWRLYWEWLVQSRRKQESRKSRSRPLLSDRLAFREVDSAGQSTSKTWNCPLKLYPQKEPASTEGADSSPISWGAGGSSACKREWPTSMGVFQGTPEAASSTESYFTENSRWMKCMHPGPWIGASAYLAWVAGLSLWGGWPAAYFHSAYLGSNNGWTLFIDFSTFWNNIVKKKN